MREIRYKILLGVAPGPQRQKIKKTATLAGLVLDIPYLMKPGGPMPSFEQLDDLFKRGGVDSGMSGGLKWTPFELTRDEYAELILELVTRPRQ